MFSYKSIFIKTSLYLIAFIISSPIISYFFAWSSIDHNLWQHLLHTFLPEALTNTIKLMVSVSILSLILGSSLAYVCTRINFTGARFFSFFLLTPLCFSKFIMGFSYLSFFEHGGPLQRIFRFYGFDLSSQVAHNHFSILVLVLSLSLFPYVFLATVSGLHQENKEELDAASSLGAGFFTQLRTITIPHLKPYLLTSSLLVSLEVYGDFGASSIFGVDTISTSIYKVWASFFSLKTASQMATIAIFFVSFLYFLETKWSPPASNSNIFSPCKKIDINKKTNIILFIGCMFIFTISFILPFAWMIFMFINSLKDHLFDFSSVLKSSIILCLITTLCVMTLSCFICFMIRNHAKINFVFLQHLIRFGYAVPSTVLAIGAITIFYWFTQLFNDHFIGFILPSVSCVIFGLSVRFFIIGYNYLKCSFSKINRDFDHAATICGASNNHLFKDIHLPLIYKGLCAGSLLVFIDSLKEMPITLMTRPIGWDTLAVKVFEYTSESEWGMAVYPSMILSLLALVSLVFTHHFLEKGISNHS